MIEAAASSMPVPGAVHDPGRLEELDSYDILDTPPEEGFDNIVKLATLACDAPVALVSLVAGDRQWFKARVGFPSCGTDLNSSVCAHALAAPDLLVIPDLAIDPRTRDNPLVTGDPFIRFYAGAPLHSPRGKVLGSLCVIDKVPRPDGLTERQADVLRTLAEQVVALMELRRSVTGRDSLLARRRKAEQLMGEAHARLQISEAHWRGLFERLSEGFIVGEVIRDAAGHAADWRYLDVNAAWGELIGAEPARVVGRTIREVFPGIADSWVAEIADVVDTGQPATFTRQVGKLNRWYEARAFPLDGNLFAAFFLDISERVRAEIRRNALLEIGDQLRDLGTVEEMTAKAASIVGQALEATRVGYGLLDRDGEFVDIQPDWTAPGVPSIAGRHRFADYGDIREELLLGEPLIIRDVLTDPRTGGELPRWEQAQIRALVNIPIQERGRTVAILLVHDMKVREWVPETVAFLHNVADRLTSGVTRLKAEADQRLLNAELSHRMKNMLAMVQAIASQTLKGAAEKVAVDSFRDRLQALSTAQDVLLQTSWTAAPLREVVQTSLARSTEAGRLTISGPDILLGPRATLSVSLLLHELATNAAKHGSLSVDGGRVDVAWFDDPATHELVFTWKERGGPLVAEPVRRGFGSRLLRGGLIGTGGVELRYRPVGLEVEMRAAIDRIGTT